MGWWVPPWHPRFRWLWSSKVLHLDTRAQHNKTIADLFLSLNVTNFFRFNNLHNGLKQSLKGNLSLIPLYYWLFIKYLLKMQVHRNRNFRQKQIHPIVTLLRVNYCHLISTSNTTIKECGSKISLLQEICTTYIFSKVFLIEIGHSSHKTYV